MTFYRWLTLVIVVLAAARQLALYGWDQGVFAVVLSGLVVALTQYANEDEQLEREAGHDV